jgi:putative flippase GtrA
VNRAVPQIGSHWLALLRQLFRYALVGITTNAIGYLVYLLITYWYPFPKVVMTMMYALGAILGYAGNRSYTFRSRAGIMSSGFKYVIAYALGYIMNLSLMIYFSDKLGYPHQWVQAGAIFVVAGFLFVAMRYFVFKGVAHA